MNEKIKSDIGNHFDYNEDELSLKLLNLMDVKIGRISWMYFCVKFTG